MYAISKGFMVFVEIFTPVVWLSNMYKCEHIIGARWIVKIFLRTVGKYSLMNAV